MSLMDYNGIVETSDESTSPEGKHADESHLPNATSVQPTTEVAGYWPPEEQVSTYHLHDAYVNEDSGYLQQTTELHHHHHHPHPHHHQHAHSHAQQSNGGGLVTLSGGIVYGERLHQMVETGDGRNATSTIVLANPQSDQSITDMQNAYVMLDEIPVLSYTIDTSQPPPTLPQYSTEPQYPNTTSSSSSSAVAVITSSASYEQQLNAAVQPALMEEAVSGTTTSTTEMPEETGDGRQPQSEDRPHTPEFSSAAQSALTSLHHRGSLQLWQFLIALLDDPKSQNLICWTGRTLEFKLNEPEEVARLWGLQKNRPAMNYDKLSRSLRYYYEKGIMQKVSGERYVYKFVCEPELLFALAFPAEDSSNGASGGNANGQTSASGQLSSPPTDETGMPFLLPSAFSKPTLKDLTPENRANATALLRMKRSGENARQGLQQTAGTVMKHSGNDSKRVECDQEESQQHERYSKKRASLEENLRSDQQDDERNREIILNNSSSHDLSSSTSELWFDLGSFDQQTSDAQAPGQLQHLAPEEDPNLRGEAPMYTTEFDAHLTTGYVPATEESHYYYHQPPPITSHHHGQPNGDQSFDQSSGDTSFEHFTAPYVSSRDCHQMTPHFINNHSHHTDVATTVFQYDAI